MISKCANPACSAHFLYLHEGRVYRVLRNLPDTREAQMGVDPSFKKHPQAEFYWLCERCGVTMTLRFRKDAGVIVEPKHAALRAAAS
jgi:hypothetical protein